MSCPLAYRVSDFLVIAQGEHGLLLRDEYVHDLIEVPTLQIATQVETVNQTVQKLPSPTILMGGNCLRSLYGLEMERERIYVGPHLGSDCDSEKDRKRCL